MSRRRDEGKKEGGKEGREGKEKKERREGGRENRRKKEMKGETGRRGGWVSAPSRGDPFFPTLQC